MDGMENGCREGDKAEDKVFGHEWVREWDAISD